MAGRWPGATGLASYPSDCIWLTSQRYPWGIADVLESSTEPAQPYVSPATDAGFVHLSVSFAELPPTGDSGTFRRVLVRSSNRSPSG